MKKLFIITIIAGLALCGRAQTNQVPNLITNATPNILATLTSLAQDVTSGTNWSIVGGGGISTDGKNGLAYAVVAYDFTANVGVIAGEDVLFASGQHQFNSLKGGITLKTQIAPLSWTGISWLQSVQGTPFVADLIATGNGGSSVGNIVATGMDFNVYAFSNFELSIGAEYDNRTGQGIYDGNYVSGHLAISRKF
jgi:hypothetical protein